MWLRKQCVLRLGRHEAQLWLKQGRQLQWLGSHTLQHTEASQPYAPVAQAMEGLAPAIPKQARLELLLDSHWLPAMLLDTGPAPLSGHQIQALAAHRFAESRGEAARQWQYMSDYVAGTRNTLAFGYPTQLRQTIADGLATHMPSAALSGLQPTLSWAMASAPGKANTGHVCTLLHEQDRSLLVFTRGRHVDGFHPAALISKEPQHLMRDVALHATRCGAFASEWAVHVLSFDAAPTGFSSGLAGIPLAWSRLAPREAKA